MSIEDIIKNDTGGPYGQFDNCTKTINCKFKSETGKCIYETCVYEQELPKTVTLMRYKCKVCDAEEYRDPREMKIQICDSCLSRMLSAEKLPFTCVFCGASQEHPSKIFLSGICDTCFSKLNRSRTCKKCGNS